MPSKTFACMKYPAIHIQGEIKLNASYYIITIIQQQLIQKQFNQRH